MQESIPDVFDINLTLTAQISGDGSMYQASHAALCFHTFLFLNLDIQKWAQVCSTISLAQPLILLCTENLALKSRGRATCAVDG